MTRGGKVLGIENWVLGIGYFWLVKISFAALHSAQDDKGSVRYWVLRIGYWVFLAGEEILRCVATAQDDKRSVRYWVLRIGYCWLVKGSFAALQPPRMTRGVSGSGY